MSRRRAITPVGRFPRRLKCFVAMALGRPETDRLYDRVIVPTLDAVNLRAIRIDRIEHNDDIDNRIIQELKDCRVVIADLTFARPSVYFEAGYAQCVIPVIYTCRKDHFDRGAPDGARVHFDLQMRNIIAWSQPDDSTFRLRLAKRLNYILRPVLQEERRALQHGVQEAQFRALSVDEQRRAMKQVLQEEFARAKFKRFGIRGNNDRFFSDPEYDLRAKVCYGFKRRGTSLNMVEGLVPDSGALKLLSKAAYYESTLQKEWFEANTNEKGLYFSRRIFVCTLEKISRQSFLRSFSNFTFDSERECFTGALLGIFSWQHAGHLYRLPLSIHVLDGVRSLDELRLQIRQRLGEIELQKLKRK